MAIHDYLPSNLRTWRDSVDQPLQRGGCLARPQQAYSSWGTLNAAADNVVWICHALTGNSDAASWWSGLVGPGKALDPARYFIVCANILGSCYGSTGPTSEDPRTGRRYGGHFPALSIGDMVVAQRRLADHLGINQIALVLGGSMGGFQALEWAAQDARVQRLGLVATSAHQPANAIALSTLQCAFIERDAAFAGGHYAPGSDPHEGLALARQLGHYSYRSSAELASRFGRSRRDDDTFNVVSYLGHQGNKLANRFDANSYLRLNAAMNHFALAPEQLSALHQPTLVVSVSSDQLYVPNEQRALASAIAGARLHSIDSLYGHDGFLLESVQFEQPVADLLAAPAANRPATALRPKPIENCCP